VNDAFRRQVEAARVARLATVDPNGRPHLVPICFALAGETLYSAVDRKPKRSLRLQRLENARVNPTVEVLVDHYEDDWSRLWWARLRGRARVLEQGQERRRALVLLARKYAQYRNEPPPGPVLAVDIGEWRVWQA
jgi:PPOX class probable F420-dependent enzyme